MRKPVALSSLAISIGAAAVLALLAGGAAAQMPMPGMTLTPDANRQMTDEEKAKQKALDDKYKSTMQSIPDKKAPADPWGNIRTAPATPSKQR